MKNLTTELIEIWVYSADVAQALDLIERRYKKYFIQNLRQLQIYIKFDFLQVLCYNNKRKNILNF